MGRLVRAGGGETGREPAPRDDTHRFLLVPCFRVCFIPILTWFTPSSAFSLHLAVFPPPGCVAKHGHAICKVSRCTSPNNQSGAPARSHPPVCGRTPSGAPWVPCTRPRSLGAVAPRGAGRSSAGSRGTTAPGSRHSDRFPAHAGKSPPASVCALAPASTAWIALLFLSWLQFAAEILVSPGLAGLLVGGASVSARECECVLCALGPVRREQRRGQLLLLVPCPGAEGGQGEVWWWRSGGGGVCVWL
uniref:Uncharacterized protein n=1 Tax=Rangifer tarandus platyrhynchus TaxID=3082113 RepID=A0ACB0ED54_RANTA|nr:unnamed protein product [Rangifer tarandus platyrhynchus]